MDSIERARHAAGRYLAERGYEEEARLASGGKGDDFAEVRIALQLIAHQDDRVRRYEKALSAYADKEFWGGDLPGTALADDDQGRIARYALAGVDAPIRYYD